MDGASYVQPDRLKDGWSYVRTYTILFCRNRGKKDITNCPWTLDDDSDVHFGSLAVTVTN